MTGRALLSVLLLAAPDAGAAWIGRCDSPPPANQATVLETLLNPGGGPATFVVVADRRLPGCALQEIPVDPSAVVWARMLAPANAAALRGGIIIQGADARGRFTVSDAMPLAEPPRPAPAPIAGAPSKPPATRLAPKRALWVWDPDAWRRRPEALFALLAANGADTVFITAPVDRDHVVEPGPLAIFITQASARGLRVQAVVGDPRAVLPAERPKFTAIARAYAEFNRGAPPEARLAGLQLDIEPYLNDGYHFELEGWLDAYLETVAQIRPAAAMPLDVAVPFWWGTQQHRGASLLDRLASLVDSATVMNYRTDRRQILESAEPFLAWSDATRRSVRIALEAGPIRDESLRVYRPAAAKGELWILPAGERSLAVLLETQAAGLPGQPFAFSHAIPRPGSRVSFRGNLAALRGLLPELEDAWRAWRGFDGIALHGLD